MVIFKVLLKSLPSPASHSNVSATSAVVAPAANACDSGRVASDLTITRADRAAVVRMLPCQRQSSGIKQYWQGRLTAALPSSERHTPDHTDPVLQALPIALLKRTPLKQVHTWAALGSGQGLAVPAAQLVDTKAPHGAGAHAKGHVVSPAGEAWLQAAGGWNGSVTAAQLGQRQVSPAEGQAQQQPREQLRQQAGAEPGRRADGQLREQAGAGVWGWQRERGGVGGSAHAGQLAGG